MREWSKHHVIFPRPLYTTPDELAFRRHQGLIPHVLNEFHFEDFPTGVHALVEPPIKPSTEHILGALIMLDCLRSSVLEDPAQTIARLGDYMIRMREPMGENLHQQLEIIREGIVR